MTDQQYNGSADYSEITDHLLRLKDDDYLLWQIFQALANAKNEYPQLQIFIYAKNMETGVNSVSTFCDNDIVVKAGIIKYLLESAKGISESILQ